MNDEVIEDNNSPSMYYSLNAGENNNNNYAEYLGGEYEPEIKKSTHRVVEQSGDYNEEDTGGDHHNIDILNSTSINQDEMMIDNLDVFFSDMYSFHKAHGFKPFILETCSQVFFVTCGLVLFSFLTLCINWSNFLSCGRVTSDQVCKNIFGWFISNNVFWIMCNIFFWLYWIILVRKLFSKFSVALQMNVFYRNILQLSEIDTMQFTWNQIVDRVIIYQNQGKIPSIRKNIDADIIASYITRNENFSSLLIQQEKIDRRFFSSRILTWLLGELVLNKISRNQKIAKDDEFLNNPEKFKSKFRFYAILSLPFVIFILIYHITMTFFKNIQNLAVKNSSSSSSHRWNTYAKLKLRKYNEISFQTNHRLNSSTKYADMAIHCYPNHVLKQLVKIISFPISCLTGLIILFTLNDTSMLFNISIFDRPLFLYLTILGPIAFLCKSYLSSISNVNLTTSLQKKELLDNLILHGLLCSSSSNNETSEKRIYIISKYLNQLYQHRIVIFFHEIYSILALPWLLGIVLPRSSECLLEFLNQSARIHKDIGVICVCPAPLQSLPSSPLILPSKPFEGLSMMEEPLIRHI